MVGFTQLQQQHRTCPTGAGGVHKYTEETIIGILKERQDGMKVADLTRKYAVSEQSIYCWQARYGGMTVCEAKRSRQLEEENALKRMVAEPSLAKQM